MTLETILTDAAGHFAAGFVLSISDYATHRVANPRASQLIDKENVMKSMEFIVSAQEKFEKGDKSEKLTWQYGQNIEAVRDHLEAKGLIKSNKGFVQNTKHYFSSLWYDERVNDKTLNQKIARVAIAEGAYNYFFGFQYALTKLQYSPIAAGLGIIYQTAAATAGLVVGRGATLLWEKIIRQSFEKELDQKLECYLKQSPVVDLVVNYNPIDLSKETGSDLDKVLEQKGISYFKARFTQAGSVMSQYARRAGEGFKEARERARELGRTTYELGDNLIHFHSRLEESARKDLDAKKKAADGRTARF